MKTFLKLFAIITTIVLLLGLLLPNDVDVQRSVEINASTIAIHPYINNLENWSHWSPWLAQDPSIKTTIGEITSDVGASQSWQGVSGSGSLTITSSSIQNGVVYDMRFEGDPTLYRAGFEYTEKGDKTTVTWFMRGEMKPIIIGNYFALLMDTFVGDSFQQGLDKLKTLAEK